MGWFSEVLEGSHRNIRKSLFTVGNGRRQVLQLRRFGLNQGRINQVAELDKKIGTVVGLLGMAQVHRPSAWPPAPNLYGNYP